MPDTHEDIRRRLFDAAWETPTYAPAAERTVSRARRRAAMTMGGAALAAVLAIVVGASSLQVEKTKQTGTDVDEVDDREFVLDVATGKLTEVRDFTEGSWLFERSPTVDQMAFTRGTGGYDQVWVSDLDGTDPRQLTQDPHAASDPAWSPDGQEIVYVGFGRGTMRGLFVVDVATGATQRVLRAESDPWNPEWSPDGDRILYHVALPVSDAGTAGLAVVNSFQLRILDLDTGEITVVAGSKEDSAFDGSWLSPDRIVFMRGIDHSPAGVDHFELWTVELATGSRERLLNVGEASWAWEASVSPDRRRIAYVKSVDGDDRVFVLDLGTGRTRQTTSAWYPIWLDDGTLFVQRKPDPDADSTSP